MNTIIKKDIIYIDRDGVVANFAKKWTEMYGKELDLYHIPPTPNGFYSDLEVIPNSKNAIKKLSEHFDVYFLSTAEWNNISSWSDKRIWIEKHFGKYAHKRLILSHNKSLHIGKYLIDDRAIDTNLAFTGEFIHFGSAQFPNWSSVVNYIFTKEAITLENSL
jgi:5'(3')-deoxyribonucleotidase